MANHFAKKLEKECTKMTYGEICEGEVFPKNEFFEVKAKAEELYKEIIERKKQREKEVQQIRETVYAIFDLVRIFRLYGEAVARIKIASCGEEIRIGVLVFRENVENDYFDSFGADSLSEAIKEKEKEFKQGKYSIGIRSDLRRIINRFDGWSASCANTTGDNSFTISFED